MGQAKRALLLDEMNAHAVLRAVAKRARHLIPQMTDDNVDFRNATVAHHFDLMGEQWPVEDRKNRLGAAVRKRIHSRALAGGEDHARDAAVEISHEILRPACSAPA